MNHRKLAAVLLSVFLPAAATVAANAPTGSFDSRFAEARGLALDGKRDAALAAYSALLDESPGNSDVLVGRGRVHAWMEHWVEAEKDLLEAVQAAPRYGDAWSALGDVYLWSGRPQRAVEAYSHWIELAPQAGEPLAARGRAHRAAGDLAAAQADFRAAAARGIDAAALLDSLVAAESRDNLAGSRSAEVFLPGKYHWIASLAVDRTQFKGAGMEWTDSVASLRRQWDGVSLGIEALESRRFGITDHAVALDGYFPLWQRAYINARAQHSSGARLFPENRWRGELFQGIGAGWELSAGYDRLDFAVPAELVSIGVGRYAGPWYLRLRYQHVPGTSANPGGSNSERLVARYYYRGGSDHYIEVNADTGHSDPSMAATAPRLARNRSTIGGSWAGLITEHIGARLSIGHGYGYESEPYHHTTLSAAVYSRW